MLGWGVRWGTVSAWKPSGPASPFLGQASHAKMEHSRLPLASWGRKGARLSGKCARL